MKKFLAVLAAITLLAGAAMATQTGLPDGTLYSEVAQTNADSASVALDLPNVNQTVVIKRIQLWYDNAANTNPFYAGIITQNAAHTRHLWLGTAMASSGIATIDYDNINLRITPSTAQSPGLRLFLSAASSDSIYGRVEYVFVSE